MDFTDREQLRIGAMLSYSYPNMNGLVLRGTIIHIGLGMASRNAVWVRCSDGWNKGNVECVMLGLIIGVTPDVSK
jgi:hypothetical protein